MAVQNQIFPWSKVDLYPRPKCHSTMIQMETEDRIQSTYAAIKKQDLQILNIIDTVTKHQFSSQSTYMLKGCIYVCFI